MLEVIGVFSLYTLIIWPFTFVGGLVYAIKNIIKDESPKVNIHISAISLIFILLAIITASLG